MSDIQEEMKQIREKSDELYHKLEKAQETQVNATYLLEKDTQAVLDTIAYEFIAGDRRLFLLEKTNNAPGFVIGYHPMQDWNVKTFVLSAKCASDKIEVSVSDGHWEQAPNIMGNWADWADVLAVYSGPLEEHKLRGSIEKQFKKWYERTLSELRQ